MLKMRFTKQSPILNFHLFQANINQKNNITLQLKAINIIVPIKKTFTRTSNSVNLARQRKLSEEKKYTM